ncbi:hypothetical protein GGR56DRAFT_575010 [Xylariaceae sp. FL0804]|nr:hypothetical protein GGR56DRAFT_575010 [Xylariaceae sp. FL0804]
MMPRHVYPETSVRAGGPAPNCKVIAVLYIFSFFFSFVLLIIVPPPPTRRQAGHRVVVGHAPRAGQHPQGRPGPLLPRRRRLLGRLVAGPAVVQARPGRLPARVRAPRRRAGRVRRRRGLSVRCDGGQECRHPAAGLRRAVRGRGRPREAGRDGARAHRRVRRRGRALPLERVLGQAEGGRGGGCVSSRQQQTGPLSRLGFLLSPRVLGCFIGGGIETVAG